MNIDESKSLLGWVSLNKLYIDTHNECDYHNIHTAIETLLTAYEKEKETSHYNQSQLDIANAKLVEEKEKNKELTDKLKDCDLHYSKLYKFHNNNCVTKDRINQIIDELIKLYFEEDSYCFSGFMFNNKTFNSLNIKEEMTVMQLLKHLQRLLKQEEE